MCADFRVDARAVLRTPLLPISTLTEWADAARSASGAHGYVRDLLARREVFDAIRLASPDLSDRLRPWCADPAQASNGQAVQRSVAKYLARMAARATPFGLFAGVSPARLGDATDLALGPRGDYRRHTQLSCDHLRNLCAGLLARDGVREQIRYLVNPSLYHVAGRLRFVIESNGTVQLGSLESSPMLNQLCDSARTGRTLDALTADLFASQSELSMASIRMFVEELVSAQVLVPALGIVVCGPELLDSMAASLVDAGLAEEAAEVHQLRRRLRELDAAGVTARPPDGGEGWPALRDDDPGSGRAFHVDLVKPARATFSRNVVTATTNAIEWLHGLQAVGSEWTEFCARFVARWGEQEVPLGLALDEELGIDFGDVAGYANDSPLLEGVQLPREPAVSVAPRPHPLLLQRFTEAIATGATEIVLEPDDVRALKTSPLAPLPDAMYARIRVAAGHSATGNEELIFFDHAAGPSGARIHGRFCHALPELVEVVEAHVKAEEALRPDAIFAEVVLCDDPSLGHLAGRPHVREHEIVLVGLYHSPAHKVLRVDDLAISVRAGRVRLSSREDGREIIPRISNAIDHRRCRIALHRFVAALQSQGAQEHVAWSWGALSQAPFLPRVRISNVIVSRATWRLTPAEQEMIAAGKRTARRHGNDSQRLETEVARLRHRRKLPRFVIIREDDLELPIDLDNPMLLDVFADEVIRSGGVIAELYPPPEEAIAHGPEGRFANELVVTMVREASAAVRSDAGIATAPRSAIGGPSRSVATIATQRSFPPGSSWLYVKIYTGAVLADRLLSEVIGPFAGSALSNQDIDQWFFLRYADPEQHVRVRFAGRPERLLGKVVPALADALEPLRDDHEIWRICYDTYDQEIERYGGPAGLLACERMFAADSAAAIELIRLSDADAGPERWKLGLASADAVLAAFSMPASVRERVVTGARDRGASAIRVGRELFRAAAVHYRAARDELEAIVAGGGVPPSLVPAVAILDRRGADLAREVAALRELEARRELLRPLEEIATSLLHMSLNRILRAPSLGEELAIYDHLRRLYGTLRSRGVAPRIP